MQPRLPHLYELHEARQQENQLFQFPIEGVEVRDRLFEGAGVFTKVFVDPLLGQRPRIFDSAEGEAVTHIFRKEHLQQRRGLDLLWLSLSLRLRHLVDTFRANER